MCNVQKIDQGLKVSTGNMTYVNVDACLLLSWLFEVPYLLTDFDWHWQFN